MGIILFVIAFVLLSFIYSKFNFESFEVFLFSLLSQLILILFLTESLSAFLLIYNHFIGLSWLLIDVILFGICIYLYKGFKFKLNYSLPKFNAINTIVVFVFLLLTIQSLVYPPNNYDAMTYHMARLPNWLANHSLRHYATNIYRQLYQPPLSSIILLHINVLSGSDIFSNLLQVFFLYVLLKTLVQIGAILGVKQIENISIVLITIPAVVLQASSVTNNIIEASFVAIALLYALKLRNEMKVISFLVLGVSAGLSILTKGTAYIFVLPIFVFCGIDALVNRQFLKKASLLLLSGILALGLNVFHYQRNYQLTGSFLGTDPAEKKMYSNQDMSISRFCSNGIKNIGNHLGPYPLSIYTESAIYKTHDLLGIPINGEGINFNNFDYHVTASPNTEDNAPNLIHVVLMLFSIVLVLIEIIRRKRHFKDPLVFTLGIIVLQFVFFNIFLKWQPWHSRNHISMFVEFVPILALIVFDGNKLKRYRQILLGIMIFYAVLLIVFNRLRPFISYPPYTSTVSLFSSRDEKYFADRTHLIGDFLNIKKELGDVNYHTIGINIYWNEYEYPYFKDCFSMYALRPYHIIDKPNPSIKIINGNYIPDYIISDRIYLDVIDFKFMKYYKITKDNSNIALYKRID